jgi:hypothetical protein
MWRFLARWTLLLLPVLFGTVTYILENTLSANAAAEFTVVLQFIVGNFPNSQIINPQSPWFAMGVFLRFTLAYAPTYGAGLVFVKLLKWKKEQTMEFLDLLRDRDLAIEQQILNVIPLEQREQYRAQVESAIATAAQLWENKYLPILVGGPEAAHKTLHTQVRR